MKKLLVVLILQISLCLPSFGAKVFVYHIPDTPKSEKQVETPKTNDIVSDDVTADTSGIEEEDIDEEEIVSEEEYQLGDMYSDVLKGYAIYDEEEEQSIFLESDNYFKLDLAKHQSPKISNLSGLTEEGTKINFNSSKFNAPEYLVTPISSKNYRNFWNGFGAGTIYSQEVSFGELEQTSGVYSRYQYKNFALNTIFSKTVNTTNNNYNDKIGISPEIKLNQYITVKENFSTDLIKKKNKAELVLSINPLGKKDIDRIRLDFGASRTYNIYDASFKNQIQFETKIKF